jgi:uncharacterized protein
MFGKNRITRWIVGAAILAVAEFACVVAVEFVFAVPAEAQRYDDRYPFMNRQRQRGGGDFFQQFFDPFDQRQRESEPAQAPVDYSHAPSPRKPDSSVTPTTSIVVLGDSMADWLAYGLEDAFSESPEIAVIRKNKPRSGLLHYDVKSNLDWWHAARDILVQEKPSYVIIMLGIADRQSIREKDLPKEPDNKAKEKDQQDKAAADKTAADKTEQSKDKPKDQNQTSIVAPEPQQAKKSTNGIIEFRTDQWAEIYSRRIDETVAALKSKGVPVFWVGLPSLRGPRPTADAVYLNDLYRARAERAGAVYIDVWDGFVDEGGKYSNTGPDYEGQTRRLRSNDGVYFTKYGARKLAHFVEREVRRFMSNRALPVALPVAPVAPQPVEGKSVARPLAGPVVPLTVTPGNSDELLGGSSAGATHSDAIASRVLVKGEPVAAPPGRADDFVWRGGGDANAALPVAAMSAAATAAAPVEKKPEPKSAAAKTTENAAPKPKPQRQQPARGNAERSFLPPGWLR